MSEKVNSMYIPGDKLKITFPASYYEDYDEIKIKKNKSFTSLKSKSLKWGFKITTKKWWEIWK